MFISLSLSCADTSSRDMLITTETEAASIGARTSIDARNSIIAAEKRAASIGAKIIDNSDHYWVKKASYTPTPRVPTVTPTPMPISVNTGSINIYSEKNIQFNYMKSSLVNKNKWTVATNNSILNSGVSYLPAGFALLTDKDLTFLSNSLLESKLVDVAYLDAVHPELKNMWVEFYIPSLELQHHYFSMQIKNPGLLKDVNTPSGLAQLEKLYNGIELGIIWADWYDINAESISDGWYNLK